ncbi:MAG TPA: LysM peptidoglycan-binding domain-containing protein, partial [Chloroflexi bacterium]|nr:LysM peptidoglycan-binding domain-containing protein [Chloroflexota bacterium]
RVRTLLAVILALGLLIPMVSAYAQDQNTAVTPNDKICVEGSVINFNEVPLSDYTWTINYGPAGSTDEPSTVTTDEYGKFKIEEGLSVGDWTFSLDPTVNGPWEGITALSFNVPLKYGSDACVQVRWKLVRRVPVIVTKIDDQHNPLNDWIIRAEPARGNWFASPVEEVTGDPDKGFGEGQVTFYLTEGQWNFKEYAPAGVHYTPIVPTNGRQSLLVEWKDADQNGQPDPIYLRFKNRVTEYGCIDVYKYDVPVREGEAATPLPGWKITVKRANGTVVATGYTDAAGKVTFSNLPFGPYTVIEELRAGWTPAYPTGFTAEVTQAEPCVEVNFINEQDFGYSFVGRKIDTNGKVGLPDWKITIKPLDKGGALPLNGTEENGTAYVLTDGLGNYRFDFATNDYRVPGARYQICEEQKAGWLPHTPLCYNVRLPSKPGSPVKVWDFENQQVGHWESVIYGPAQGGSSGSCRFTVTVQPGDSLYGIGAAYGVSASAMLAANPWVYSRPHYYVYPGDSVCVP